MQAFHIPAPPPYYTNTFLLISDAGHAVIIDPATTHELNTLFEQEKKESFRLTKEKWNQWRTPFQKFKGWFAHLLAPFL